MASIIIINKEENFLWAHIFKRENYRLKLIMKNIIKSKLYIVTVIMKSVFAGFDDEMIKGYTNWKYSIKYK